MVETLLPEKETLIRIRIIANLLRIISIRDMSQMIISSILIRAHLAIFSKSLCRVWVKVKIRNNQATRRRNQANLIIEIIFLFRLVTLIKTGVLIIESLILAVSQDLILIISTGYLLNINWAINQTDISNQVNRILSFTEEMAMPSPKTRKLNKGPRFREHRQIRKPHLIPLAVISKQTTQPDAQLSKN